jgi:hypothetical protein
VVLISYDIQARQGRGFDPRTDHILLSGFTSVQHSVGREKILHLRCVRSFSGLVGVVSGLLRKSLGVTALPFLAPSLVKSQYYLIAIKMHKLHSDRDVNSRVILELSTGWKLLCIQKSSNPHVCSRERLGAEKMVTDPSTQPRICAWWLATVTPGTGGLDLV